MIKSMEIRMKFVNNRPKNVILHPGTNMNFAINAWLEPGGVVSGQRRP